MTPAPMTGEFDLIIAVSYTKYTIGENVFGRTSLKKAMEVFQKSQTSLEEPAFAESIKFENFENFSKEFSKDDFADTVDSPLEKRNSNLKDSHPEAFEQGLPKESNEENSKTNGPQDEFERIIFETTNDKEMFYQFNNMHKYEEDGPYTRLSLIANEKKFDNIEAMLKRWTELMKEVSRCGLAQVKAFESFSNQLLVDKDIFLMNKEIYHLFLSLSYFIKEYNTYFEIFLKILVDSIQTYPDHYRVSLEHYSYQL